MAEKNGVYKVISFVIILACLLAVGMILYDGWDKWAPTKSRGETEGISTETGTKEGMGSQEDGPAGAALPSGISGIASSLPPIADIAEAVSPAVVRIDVVMKVSSNQSQGGSLFDDFFKNFGRQEYEMSGSGSGFVISSDGYIVTNHHVIDQATQIKVTMLDGKVYDAKLVGSYAAFDVAVLKIEAQNLPYAVLGTSDDLRPGEWVVAIGNPHGFDHTVTVGIVSALDRNLSNVDGAEDISQAELIQTDAAINSGNSGGPLIDMEGRVVGINTAIIPYAQGISFAISIDSVKDVISQLKTTGRYDRPWLGIWYYALNQEAADQLGIKESSGIYVAEVAAGGPAEKAGMKKGDVIKSFDGKTVDSKFNLSQEVRDKGIGEKVQIGVVRDGKTLSLTVTLAKAPEDM
ncbi:MAG TPA: trypsin-like peptidase domain-containing protein [Bacillota bacterium]|nr:trypsin-like peptidase domain-containing protein [Bacillota bacterium]HOA15121.1 trypsin-like peptidase domain-containing protein [Bacillota bacterium]